MREAAQDQNKEGEEASQGEKVNMLNRFTAAVAAAGALLVFSASASALSPGTGWEAFSSVAPTNLPPGGTGEIQVSILNTGAVPSTGSITVTDTLPLGVTATKAGGFNRYGSGASVLSSKEEEEEYGDADWVCSGTTVVTCTSNPEFLPELPRARGSHREPYITERIGLLVEVEASAPEHSTNQVTVAGGGALNPTTVSDPVTVSSASPGFGFPGWDVWFTNANGTSDTQAGSHPYAATFALSFNELANGEMAGGEARDLDVDLPPGFFGDANAVPQCTRAQLDGQVCPAQTQIGVVRVGKAEEGGGGEGGSVDLAVYNMVPPAGVPNEFAYSIAGAHAFFDAGVRSGGGYGLVEHIDNIPQQTIDKNILTIWGVPAEASHDSQRYTSDCIHGCASGVIPKAFLTLPTSCAGPQPFTVLGLSTWQNPDASAESSVLSHDSSDTPAGFTGCEKLTIEPSLSAVPDTTFADTPAGLTAELKVPQETLTLPQGLVASTLKDTEVTLPEGVVINPGQAAGLVACQEAEANVHGEGPQSCPAASKVGTVNIKTPLLEGELEGELEGNVYVLQSNPPNLQLLLAASGDGIYLKLVGDVHLNEQTGRLTTTFTETPALPFTDFKLSFSGGAQAALATPTGCGSYTTDSLFTPWTSPYDEDVPFSSSFSITGGPGGSPCASPLPFSPSLIAGATTDQAGGYTDFSLLLQRADDQQRIEKLQFKTPAGLLGMISKVPLCDEADANAGTCPAASEIGHTVIQSGPGPYPLQVPESGQPQAPIYLTSGYGGAPYGLSIVVPLHVGPFTLQTQVVRASINVDPHTAQLTITTSPLPQIIDGIPTDLRTINAVIDRPGFMFNPTSCKSQEFAGTATSAQGTSAPISSHFQVGSCQSLQFAPDFKVSTQAKTSKADGASLTAKILYPTGALGANQASSQANVAAVKVDLPEQLPSRLTTLQKACLAKVFEANPAACPKESIVGHATAITPVLPVPVSGPAYFVSHGGEAFPSLILVLQGYGVTVDLVGATFISKAGITSSTFKQVPDVPITSFELTLPEGPFSALAANLPERDHGDLCGQNLQMPTAFIGQNGAEIHDSTTIGISGCPKAKALTRAKKLANALKACKQNKSKARRAECEATARKDYGPVKKAKKK
jgi:uncharacterized repeat protein (TIGR01451 family)